MATLARGTVAQTRELVEAAIAADWETLLPLVDTEHAEAAVAVALTKTSRASDVMALVPHGAQTPAMADNAIKCGGPLVLPHLAPHLVTHARCVAAVRWELKDLPPTCFHWVDAWAAVPAALWADVAFCADVADLVGWTGFLCAWNAAGVPPPLQVLRALAHAKPINALELLARPHALPWGVPTEVLADAERDALLRAATDSALRNVREGADAHRLAGAVPPSHVTFDLVHELLRDYKFDPRSAQELACKLDADVRAARRSELVAEAWLFPRALSEPTLQEAWASMCALVGDWWDSDDIARFYDVTQCCPAWRVLYDAAEQQHLSRAVVTCVCGSLEAPVVTLTPTAQDESSCVIA